MIMVLEPWLIQQKEKLLFSTTELCVCVCVWSCLIVTHLRGEYFRSVVVLLSSREKERMAWKCAAVQPPTSDEIIAPDCYDYDYYDLTSSSSSDESRGWCLYWCGAYRRVQSDRRNRQMIKWNVTYNGSNLLSFLIAFQFRLFLLLYHKYISLLFAQWKRPSHPHQRRVPSS